MRTFFAANPAPRPGTTFKVTAIQPADAARTSCFVGAMVQSQSPLDGFWSPNSVTKGVTKALKPLLGKSLPCRRSELVLIEVLPS